MMNIFTRELEDSLITQRNRLHNLADKSARRAEAYAGLAALADSEAELQSLLTLSAHNARQSFKMNKQASDINEVLKALG